MVHVWYILIQNILSKTEIENNINCKEELWNGRGKDFYEILMMQFWESQ